MRKPRMRTGKLGKGITVGVLAALAAATVFLGRPVTHLALTAYHDVDSRQPPARGMVDDASRLNAVRMAEVWTMPGDLPAEQAEAALAETLASARLRGRKVSIGGARHSMGGQSLYPDGVLIDMSQYDHFQIDEQTQRLVAQAGARWSQILPQLDSRQLSIGVMQSNSSFTVGGSVSVNCHGWQHDQPPICSTVQSLRIMTAQGDVVRCSREQNAELFSLAVGGYGLFGVILEVELRLVPNRAYRPERRLVSADDYARQFSRLVEHGPATGMAYGRLRVTQEQFLEQAVLNIYRIDASQGQPPPLSRAGYEGLRRALFRGSASSDYGKQLRWQAESSLEPRVRTGLVSRNTLLSEPTDVFENRSQQSTDVLHEYFVPHGRLGEFLTSARTIVPRHDANLLNVTIRSLQEDRDTFLRYADGPMFSLVMLFEQSRTPAAERAMQAMTVELIDAALAVGGRYYLPYRLHATAEQFARAYPQAGEFFRRKRKYDSSELFQNRFYARYGR